MKKFTNTHYLPNPARLHAPSSFTLRPINLGLLLALSAVLPRLAHAEHHADVIANAGAKPDAAVHQVVVSGSAADMPSGYAIKHSSTATKLDLSPRETPQSLTTVTREQMDDFKLDTLNQVLSNTNGVTVEKMETERNMYTARGFNIINFQFDGIGMPLNSNILHGDMDTGMIDRIDVLRGASGLINSTGNPSATVNYVRKRPTADFHTSGGISYGSWNARRFDVDVSGPLNAAGTVRARAVVAKKDADSYLDRYHNNNGSLYGVIEADLGKDTLLTVGHSYQKTSPTGTIWSGIPLFYNDDTPTNYSIHTNTAAKWSHWDALQNRSFAELKHNFNKDWVWKTTLGHNQLGTEAELFMAAGSADKKTGLGLRPNQRLFRSDEGQTLFDTNLSGKYVVGGRQHDLDFGVNSGSSHYVTLTQFAAPIRTQLSESVAFAGEYSKPSKIDSTDFANYTEQRTSLYGATRLNLSDDAKLLLGANYTRVNYDGVDYGSIHKIETSQTSPYIGLVYDLSKTISAYGSYASIFNPQIAKDINGHALEPVKGKSYELGVKGEFFNRKLNASSALFRVEQNNVAEEAGKIRGESYYVGKDGHSQGLEIDLSGEVARGWQVNSGYTTMTIKDSNGEQTRTYIPRQSFHLATTYQLPQFEKLKIGASVNWQGDIYKTYSATRRIDIPAYALLNLMASYDINKHVSLNFNINNVTNKKRYISLSGFSSHYAEPLSAKVSLNWKY